MQKRISIIFVVSESKVKVKKPIKMKILFIFWDTIPMLSKN